MKKIYCVIPAYNEQEVIVATINNILDFWKNKKNKYIFKLVVVNDGSTDNTKTLVRNINRKGLSLLNQRNTGKGGALRKGVLSIDDADIVYFLDADLPYSLNDQYTVVSTVSNKYPVIYGTRHSSGNFQSNSIKRKLGSLVLSFLNKNLLNININDTQCGLKAFKSDVVKELFRRNDINDFSFDLFNTALLAKWGIPIKEVPVKLMEEIRESKVSFLKTSISMLRTIIRTRARLSTENKPRFN